MYIQICTRTYVFILTHIWIHPQTMLFNFSCALLLENVETPSKTLLASTNTSPASSKNMYARAGTQDYFNYTQTDRQTDRHTHMHLKMRTHISVYTSTYILINLWHKNIELSNQIEQLKLERYRAMYIRAYLHRYDLMGVSMYVYVYMHMYTWIYT